MPEYCPPLDNSCSLAEGRLDVLRGLPGSTERYRFTVACVIFALEQGEVVLCVPDDHDGSLENGLKFPQEGIKRPKRDRPAETVVSAYLRGVREELGMPPELFTRLYDLPGVGLFGKPGETGRRKLLLPMVGVLHSTVQLQPAANELRHARWESVDQVAKLFDAQPPNKRSVRNRKLILARFNQLATAQGWLAA